MNIFLTFMFCTLCKEYYVKADVPTVQFGCAVPSMDPDQCSQVSVTRTCEDRDDCDPGHMCCTVDCGGTDCVANDLRPGQCPPVIPTKCEPMKEPLTNVTCGVDKECPKNHKCCQTGCGLTTCVKVVPVFQYGCPLKLSKPNSCSSVRECGGKSDCMKGQMCCQDCVGTKCVSPESHEKLGICPPLGSNKRCKNTDQNKCGADSDCRGMKKCCLTKCGGTSCKDPTGKPQAKLGCPLPKSNFPLSTCKSRIKTECNDDDDCKDKERCCFDFCNNSICKVPNNKDSICPPKPSITCLIDRVIGCGVDRECKGKKKCCEVECGGTKCVDPCTDNKKWRATVGMCKNCSCGRLKKNMIWLGDACRGDINGAKTQCCKSCKKYKFY